MRKAIYAMAIVMIIATTTPAAAAAGSWQPDDYNWETSVIVDNGARVSIRGINWSDPLSVEEFLLDVEKVQGSDSVAWLDARTTPSHVRNAVISTITRDPDSLVVTETTVAATPRETERMLRQLFGDEAAQAAASGWTCGWGYKKVQHRPGLLTYYWFSLKTDFCWNGTNVQATPQQDVRGDGSWGWSYEGCTSCTVMGWPAPTDYKSYARGHMNLGAWPSLDLYPWIQHIVRGNGTVSTSYHN